MKRIQTNLLLLHHNLNFLRLLTLLINMYIRAPFKKLLIYYILPIIRCEFIFFFTLKISMFNTCTVKFILNKTMNMYAFAYSHNKTNGKLNFE